MSNIKPIETQYKGYNFRSRLEARWAVFFDWVKRKYIYEPEGFELVHSGRYLPDFWLPHIVDGLADDGWGHWCEIKPLFPTESEIKKLAELCLITRHNGIIVYGNCAPNQYKIMQIKTTEERAVYHDGVFYGLNADGPLPKHPIASLLCMVPQDRIYDALHAAMSARFEFGACGATV